MGFNPFDPTAGIDNPDDGSGGSYDQAVKMGGIKGGLGAKHAYDVVNNATAGALDNAVAIRQQTEITKQQLDQARMQEDAERRRIDEKQIRALRGNYSHVGGGGDLGSSSSSTPGMSDKLGG